MDVSKFEGEESEQDDFGITHSENVLKNLENEFSKILIEIEGNPATSYYVKDYQKLFENFKENYKIRKVLADKCAELEKQVADKKQELLTSANVVEGEKDRTMQRTLETDDDAYAEEEETIELIDSIMKHAVNNERLPDNNIINQDEEIVPN